MNSLVKREKGTITVLLVLILIPSLIWTGLIVDYVRFQALEEIIGSAADLGINAVLANYNHLLKQNFGLWATGATEEDQAIFERYLHGTLDANNPIYDSQRGFFQFFTANTKEYDTVYGSPELDCQLEFLADSTLNNPQILNQQIIELQKYRTPIEGIGVLANLLPEFEEMSTENQIINRMSRIEQSLTELNNAYFTLYQNLQETMQFDDQRWHDFSANGEKRFGEIDRYFEDIWFLRRQLGASVDLEVEDYVIEEQIELKVQGIQNLANRVLSQQAQDLIYYQSFSERSIDAQLQTEDIIRISKLLSTTIEEMRNELMNPACSAELRSRIEEQLKACTGAIIAGDFTEIDTQIEWNQKVLASLTQATNRFYYETTGTRVTLATLKRLNATNYCRGDVSLPVVPHQQMTHQLAVYEVTDSSLLEPLLQTAVGIALQNRYGSLAESSDYLRMIKKAKKLLEMGNTQNNDENAIKKIPEKLWKTLPSQVANAQIISVEDSQAPNAQVDGLMQQLQNIGMVIRNRLYLEEYLAHMFSYQTIATTTVDGLGHSISNVNNYLYGSELEYLLFGSATTGINKGLAEASVFGIRFMLNYQYAMTNQELTQLVQGIAASLGALVGVAQPILQAIIRTAIVTAETACDLKQLLNGEAVVLWKSQESWQLSPSTIYAYFQGDAEEILPATEREGDGLTVNYHDYLRLLLFCPNQEKLLYRLMDLIELNLNYRNGTEGAAFGVEQMNYRLCNAYTAIQVAIEGRLNYLFFPISFLRDFKMDPNGINLRIMRSNQY